MTLGLKAWTKSGIDPKTLARRVGHASIKFMYDTYAHVIAGQDEQAAETFARKVLRQPEGTLSPGAS